MIHCEETIQVLEWHAARPDKTLQELASRIWHETATCDFSSIQDPQDEALHQQFICSVNNEAVLNVLFKIKEDELTFANDVQVAIETEDAAKVSKETVYSAKGKCVYKIQKGLPKGFIKDQHWFIKGQQ